MQRLGVSAVGPRPEPGAPPGVAARLLAAGAGAFVLLVVLRLHGFSLPYWHVVLEEPAAPEVLAGEPRWVRADDWSVQLPLALAQAVHDPPFPRVNTNVGIGEDLLVPLSLPVRHFATLFRPTQWGYFVGRDVGLAWHWWSQVLGLFAVWMAVLWRLCEGRMALCAAGAGIIVLAPYFALSSFNAAPFAIFPGLAFLGALGVATAGAPARILGSGLLLGWSGGCLALAIYPPFQVVTGYLVLALLAGALWERRSAPRLREHLRWRVAAMALGGALAAGALAAFLLDAREAIETMTHTVYPGRRTESGGGYAAWRVFASNLWATLPLREVRGARIGEAAGLASFWLFSPVLAAAVGWGRWRRRQPADPLLVALLAYEGVLLAYCLLGLPQPVARVLGLSWVPGFRSLIGVGIADALVLARFLSLPRERVRLGTTAAVVVALTWSTALAVCGHALLRGGPSASAPGLACLAALNGALAFLLLTRQRTALVLAILLAGLAACSLWFNPLVVGGAEALDRTALATRIRAIDAAAGGRSVWAVYGSHPLPNFVRTQGVRVLNGVHPLPQLALWRHFDPQARHARIYNRYAHVAFAFAPPGPARFRLDAPDAFTVAVHPLARPLRELGVTHLLVRAPDPAPFDSLPGLRTLGAVGADHLYAVRAASSASAVEEGELRPSGPDAQVQDIGERAVAQVQP